MTNMAPWAFMCPNSLERRASSTTFSCPNGGLRLVCLCFCVQSLTSKLFSNILDIILKSFVSEYKGP